MLFFLFDNFYEALYIWVWLFWRKWEVELLTEHKFIIELGWEFTEDVICPWKVWTLIRELNIENWSKIWQNNQNQLNVVWKIENFFRFHPVSSDFFWNDANSKIRKNHWTLIKSNCYSKVDSFKNSSNGPRIDFFFFQNHSLNR